MYNRIRKTLAKFFKNRYKLLLPVCTSDDNYVVRVLSHFGVQDDFEGVFVLFCFVLFCFVLFCFVLFCFVSGGAEEKGGCKNRKLWLNG